MMLGISRLWCDNGYAAILVRFGVVVFVGFVFLYLCTMYLESQIGRVPVVFGLFMFSVYGIMENFLFDLSSNIFLLAMTDVIFSKSCQNSYEMCSDVDTT